MAGFQATLVWLCAVGLFSLAAMAAFPAASDILSRLRKLFGRSKVQGVVTVAAVCLAVMYGGSKNGVVNFPRTDPEQAYLIDAGSYVSNNLVHVAFTTFLVPQDAWILLDYWPEGSTNESDMVTAYTAKLSEFPRPLNFEFAGAISNRWYCYTTWTPGPAVQTNGVWQTIWMTDRRMNRDLIPIRTRIEVDGIGITPGGAGEERITPGGAGDSGQGQEESDE